MRRALSTAHRSFGTYRAHACADRGVFCAALVALSAVVGLSFTDGFGRVSCWRCPGRPVGDARGWRGGRGEWAPTLLCDRCFRRTSGHDSGGRSGRDGRAPSGPDVSIVSPRTSHGCGLGTAGAGAGSPYCRWAGMLTVVGLQASLGPGFSPRSGQAASWAGAAGAGGRSGGDEGLDALPAAGGGEGVVDAVEGEAGAE